MISNYTKKIIGIEKFIRPVAFKDKSGNSRLIIFKGYEPHYQWFEQNQSNFDQNIKIYCFDRSSTDLALEMALRNTNKLSYISTRNYQTVTIVNRPQNIIQKQEKVNQEKPKAFFRKSSQPTVQKRGEKQRQIISRRISQRAKDILRNYNFVIKNTYLDTHPLQAYQKMCGYLMIKADPVILNYFEGFKCTEQSLSQDLLLYPILNQLRNKLMITDQLKLSKLQRNKEAIITEQMRKKYIQEWKKKTSVQTFDNAVSSFDEKQKFQWILSNNFGEELTKKDILNQKFRRHSYAIFN